MLTLLAISEDTVNNAIVGIGGFSILVWILLWIIYGVFCFLIPIFIYRIMRGQTEIIGKTKFIANPTRATAKRIFIVAFLGG
jgi:uncharacterized membrane protein